MQIMQTQVGNILYPLTEGQPLLVAVGETIRVFYTFRHKITLLQSAYRLPVELYLKLPFCTSFKIWASLYRYTVGILDRASQAYTKETITLEKTLEWKDYTGEIDIVVGSVSSGLYGLICELPDYDKDEHIDDCIDVTAPPSIFEMIGPILVIGLLAGMVLPMMKEEPS